MEKKALDRVNVWNLFCVEALKISLSSFKRQGDMDHKPGRPIPVKTIFSF